MPIPSIAGAENSAMVNWVRVVQEVTRAAQMRRTQMNLARRRPALRLMAFSLVFALGFGPIAAPGKLCRSPLIGIKARAAPEATHLYEARGDAVVAYALNKDGLPARSPDWTLTGGLRGAVWIGFDGAGYLYVSDSVLNQVRIYAPSASGDATPVQVLQLPNGGPLDSGGCAMAVNKAGYIFETVLVDGFSCSTTILVYAPVTDQPAAWIPQPIHTISVPATPYVEGLAVDAVGRLYVTPDAKLYLYNDPVNDWQHPNQTIVAEGIEHSTFAPSAIEAQSGDLYFQTQLRCCRHGKTSPSTRPGLSRASRRIVKANHLDAIRVKRLGSSTAWPSTRTTLCLRARIRTRSSSTTTAQVTSGWSNRFRADTGCCFGLNGVCACLAKSPRRTVSCFLLALPNRSRLPINSARITNKTRSQLATETNSFEAL
jgi:hypothetical protein